VGEGDFCGSRAALVEETRLGLAKRKLSFEIQKLTKGGQQPVLEERELLFENKKKRKCRKGHMEPVQGKWELAGGSGKRVGRE